MRPTTIPADSTLGREHLNTFVRLLPYLWPKGRFDLKLRVALAILLLVAAKVTSDFVPILVGRIHIDTVFPARGNSRQRAWP